MSDFEVFQFDDLVEFARDIGAVSIEGKYSEFTPGEMDIYNPGDVFKDFVTYIRDRAKNDNKYSYNYKFHICKCATINNFIEKGFYHVKYYKFFVKSVHIKKIRQKFEYIFPIHYNDIRKNGSEKMKVCKKCLWELNYKGFRMASLSMKDKIVENFDLLEFYKEYGTLLPLNDGIPEWLLNEYSKNWPEISRRIRENANWKCKKCGLDCRGQKHNLHVHHVNRLRSDNRDENLWVLCKWCHQEVHKY